MPSSKKKTMISLKLIKGDALRVLRSLPKDSADLIISSPPYNIRKDYERDFDLSLDQYVAWLDTIIEAAVERLAPTGSFCWQVGTYIRNGEIFPLDIYLYDSFKRRNLILRNRIIWKFNFGLHSSKRLSGRYETILWFTKSASYKFNLDAVRIPQLYPGKRHSNGKEAAGRPSGNPLGKNPSDYWEFSAVDYFKEQPVWDLPNVKANHPEKTFHPCQFPIELAERCVLAFTDPGDLVLDPFVGTGTSVLAAAKHQRRAIGIDKDGNYLRLARSRLRKLQKGSLKMRESGLPVRRPRATEKVARIPDEWQIS